MVYFLSVFPPFRGGISTFSERLFQELSIDKHIYAVNFLKLYPDVLFPGKTQFSNDGGEYNHSQLLHSYNPINWQKVVYDVLDKKPDAFLFSYWHPFFAPAFSFILKGISKKLPDMPRVVIAHNIIPHDTFPLGSFLSKRMFKNCTHILTLSSQTTGEASGFLKDATIVPLFHPIYETGTPTKPAKKLKKKWGFEETDKVLLFFGLVRPYKGLDILLNAFNEATAKIPNLKLLVAGEFYTPKEKYQSIIRGEIKSRVHIYDKFLSNEELAEVMKLSNALVLPYKSASQSGVFAHAAYSELPIITADHPGLTEYIEHGKNGLIFPSCDVSGLAKEIEYYFSEEKIEREMRNEMAKIKEKLSWEVFKKELEKIV